MHLPLPLALRPAAAPTSGDVIALILAFGWEGLWIIWLGVAHGVWAECVLGVLVTMLLWRHIGMALRELVRATHMGAVAL